MRRSECEPLVARLFAAFPTPPPSDSTLQVYVERLEQLRYPGALMDAIDSLIGTERWRPPISDVLAEYNRFRDRYEPPGLPEPEITEEQRAESIRRIRRLAEAVSENIGGLDA